MIARLALIPVQFIGLLAFLYITAGWLIVPPTILIGAF